MTAIDIDTAVHDGYTGTLAGFLGWIGSHLRYGGLRISEPGPASLPVPGDDRLFHRVEMVTGGYSDDEALLQRVRGSLLGIAWWASSHRGGLDVYEIPVEQMASDEPMDWLAPEDPGRIERVRYAVALEVRDAGGGRETYAAPSGADLRYRTGPDGTTTVVVDLREQA